MTRVAPLALGVLAALSLVSHPHAALGQQQQLTVEAIFGKSALVPRPPDQMFWSPDGKHLTYIDGGSLMEIDPESGKAHVMVSAEKMIPLLSSGGSERDRDHRERYNTPDYQWAPDSKRLLFDADGKLWLYDLHSGTATEIGFTGAASGDNPRFSPNGDYVSYIRDHGLWIANLRNPALPPFNLAPAPAATADKAETVLNGEVDWVYEEELDVRSNYFWSPDSKNIAYLQMNETNVPQYPLADWIPSHAQVEWQRYPEPGDANPIAHVGVVSAKGGRTT
ncbi:MAG: DPP IV N-terminal domain-containing protein, partial [Terracidiphilus sp.]